MEGTRLFAVSRNGAIWKNYDTFVPAEAHASQLAGGEAHYKIQGFNEAGQSAVIEKPYVVRVEELVYRGDRRTDGRWELVAIRAEWRAGERTI